MPSDVAEATVTGVALGCALCGGVAVMDGEQWFLVAQPWAESHLRPHVIGVRHSLAGRDHGWVFDPILCDDDGMR